MANLSYCRFQNTLGDLRDCSDHILDTGLSKEEARARRRLVDVCQDIVDAFEPDDMEDEDD
jgi:hypothetical protein